MFKFWRLGVKENQIKKNNLIGPLTSDAIKKALGKSNDIVIKNINCGEKKIDIKAIGIDGLVNSEMVDEYILKPLTVEQDFSLGLGLATEYSKTGDLSYVLKLRKGVKWTDGHEFTAKDVWFAKEGRMSI